MKRFRLEREYRERGLLDYKLRNLDDLFYVYSVKMNQIQGYSKLLNEDKSLFNRVVINYFNSHGLESENISILKVVKTNGHLKVEFIEQGEWKVSSVKVRMQN